MIDYKQPGLEQTVPGRCGWQDYSCHKCPVMQQSHSRFFFSSREPTNSSSPQRPSSSSKTQSMPFTLPPSDSSFPSCTQAHPCQRKSKAAIRAIDTWNSLILTYLNWSLCLTWCSRSTSTEEPEASAQKQQATCTLKTFYFRRATQKLPGSKLDATGL